MSITKMRAIDLYCGAGGTTTGAHMSGRVNVRLAINHWPVAIETHSVNHPDTHHVCAPIDHVAPREYAGSAWDLVFASPECTHHSNARGGRPMDDQRRAGGWDVLKWVDALRPSWLVIENVREWLDWGPLGANGRPLQSKKGETFRAWVAALESYNYRVEWRLLNAADFGEATSRTRLFVIARKGGRRIPWPEPTHARDGGGPLFPMERWRAAAEVINWSKPCPSIFERKRPLAPKTLRRIEAGLKRFVGPHVVMMRNKMDGRSLAKPLGTITAGGGHHGLAVPFCLSQASCGAPRHVASPIPTIVSRGGGSLTIPFLVPRMNERPGQAPRTHAISDPLPTVTTGWTPCVATPFITSVNHGDGGSTNGRGQSLEEPIGTITARNGRGITVPYIVPYYGTGVARPVTDPLGTITSRDRYGLVMASLIQTMQELGVVDIGFRMLDVDELLVAQGFPADYQLSGTKADQTRQIGNSVCPGVARAICEAITAA